MRLDHSIFNELTDDKIVHKQEGDISIVANKIIKVGKLASVSQKRKHLAKFHTLLLTQEYLYYVNRLDKQGSGLIKLSYKARINIEWLQTNFYTKKTSKAGELSYFIEIVKNNKNILFKCEDLKEYESWVLSLSRIAIQTNFKSKYIIKKQIGEGATSKVFLVYNIGEEKHFACKKFKKHKLSSKKSLSGLINEIKMLRALRGHPNVVGLEEVQETKNSVFLIQEYLEGGKVIEQNKNYEINDLRIVSISILKALSAIHDLGIVHRDLKPGNILLKHKNRPIPQNEIKIIDFGISTFLNSKEDHYKNCGTIGYLAPETFICQSRVQPTTKSDIYSLGIILYNAFMGMRLFSFDDEQDAFEANKRGQIFLDDFEHEFPQNCKLKS